MGLEDLLYLREMRVMTFIPGVRSTTWKLLRNVLISCQCTDSRINGDK